MKALLVSSFALLLAVGVAAQEVPPVLPNCFAGSGPDPLPAGKTLTVEYRNPAQSQGTTVHITVRSLSDPSQHLDYQVTLNGQSAASFTCNPPSNWGGVVLEAPGSQDLTIPYRYDALAEDELAGADRDAPSPMALDDRRRALRA
jgi:hypothetical protein